jgi:hypothetical protein
MPLLLPRTVAPLGARLRIPDAAPPGAWAVAGAFRFYHRDPATLVGREAQTFRSSWYATGVFAPALHVEVAEISAAEFERTARELAVHLLEVWSAPDATAAVETVREELEFALSLCAHPPGTILALQREFNEQGLIERAVVVAEAGRA